MDVLQERNRYSIFKDLDHEPVQRSELELGSNGRRVILEFLGLSAGRRSGKVKEDLTDALVDWESFVDVHP